MRTPNDVIERVVHWLQHFTLAELTFVLQQHSHSYPYDKFRIQKITQTLRHTFASQQSNEEVSSLIQDLSSEYNQSRPVHTSMSLSAMMIHRNDHQLVPFQSVCPDCHQSLGENDCREKLIRLYRYDGSVVPGNGAFFSWIEKHR